MRMESASSALAMAASSGSLFPAPTVGSVTPSSTRVVTDRSLCRVEVRVRRGAGPAPDSSVGWRVGQRVALSAASSSSAPAAANLAASLAAHLAASSTANLAVNVAANIAVYKAVRGRGVERGECVPQNWNGLDLIELEVVKDLPALAKDSLRCRWELSSTDPTCIHLREVTLGVYSLTALLQIH